MNDKERGGFPSDAGVEKRSGVIEHQVDSLPSDQGQSGQDSGAGESSSGDSGGSTDSSGKGED